MNNKSTPAIRSSSHAAFVCVVRARTFIDCLRDVRLVVPQVCPAETCWAAKSSGRLKIAPALGRRTTVRGHDSRPRVARLTRQAHVMLALARQDTREN